MQLLGEIPRTHYKYKTRELGVKEMKKIQYMEVERKWFRVEELNAAQSRSWVNRVDYASRHCADIYDAYKNPSEAKVAAWTKWAGWAIDVNMFDNMFEVTNLSICAHNYQMFTVCAIVREFDDDELSRKLCGHDLPVATYVMVVTKSYQYLYKLASDEERGDIDLCQ